MPNPRNMPHGAVAVTVAARPEYLSEIAGLEADGYRFLPCDDLKRLHWGALGSAGPDRPLAWVRMPMLLVVGPADDEEQVGETDDGGFLVTSGTLHLGDEVEQATVDVFSYHRAFSDHKERGHRVIEASEPLTYRLAFVCVTCARIVRADWDQCIDLGAALESAVKEEQEGQVQ